GGIIGVHHFHAALTVGSAVPTLGASTGVAAYAVEAISRCTGVGGIARFTQACLACAECIANAAVLAGRPGRIGAVGNGDIARALGAAVLARRALGCGTAHPIEAGQRVFTLRALRTDGA